MGDTIWVDVRGRPKGDLPRDNSIMLRLEKQLQRLCGKLNVPELSDFYDYSEIEAQYGNLKDGDDETDDESDGESADEPADESTRDGQSAGDNQSRGVWFDAGPALAAVRAIHSHLAQHPDDLGFKAVPSRTHWPAGLMEELRHCQSVLEEAVSQGRQFRFLIVP